MEFTAKTDLGFKETFDKWNGKYLNEDSYDTVISSIDVKDDIIKIYKPHGTLMGETLLACIVKRAYKGDQYHLIKDTLFSIDDTSTMRANAAGPINHEEMKAKGLIEGKDYVLRTPNSYYPLKKNGEFNRIAEANSLLNLAILAQSRDDPIEQQHLSLEAIRIQREIGVPIDQWFIDNGF